MSGPRWTTKRMRLWNPDQQPKFVIAFDFENINSKVFFNSPANNPGGSHFDDVGSQHTRESHNKEGSFASNSNSISENVFAMDTKSNTSMEFMEDAATEPIVIYSSSKKAGHVSSKKPDFLKRSPNAQSSPQRMSTSNNKLSHAPQSSRASSLDRTMRISPIPSPSTNSPMMSLSHSLLPSEGPENVPGLVMRESSWSDKQTNSQTVVQENYSFSESNFSHGGRYVTATSDEWIELYNLNYPAESQSSVCKNFPFLSNLFYCPLLVNPLPRNCQNVATPAQYSEFSLSGVPARTEISSPMMLLSDSPLRSEGSENMIGLSMRKYSLSDEQTNSQTVVQQNYSFSESDFSHGGQYVTGTSDEWIERYNLNCPAEPQSSVCKKFPFLSNLFYSPLLVNPPPRNCQNVATPTQYSEFSLSGVPARTEISSPMMLLSDSPLRSEGSENMLGLSMHESSLSEVPARTEISSPMMLLSDSPLRSEGSENMIGLSMRKYSLSDEQTNSQTVVQQNYSFSESDFSHGGQYVTGTSDEWIERYNLNCPAEPQSSVCKKFPFLSNLFYSPLLVNPPPRNCQNVATPTQYSEFSLSGVPARTEISSPMMLLSDSPLRSEGSENMLGLSMHESSLSEVPARTEISSPMMLLSDSPLRSEGSENMIGLSMRKYSLSDEQTNSQTVVQQNYSFSESDFSHGGQYVTGTSDEWIERYNLNCPAEPQSSVCKKFPFLSNLFYSPLLVNPPPRNCQNVATPSKYSDSRSSEVPARTEISSPMMLLSDSPLRSEGSENMLGLSMRESSLSEVPARTEISSTLMLMSDSHLRSEGSENMLGFSVRKSSLSDKQTNSQTVVNESDFSHGEQYVTSTPDEWIERYNLNFPAESSSSVSKNFPFLSNLYYSPKPENPIRNNRHNGAAPTKYSDSSLSKVPLKSHMISPSYSPWPSVGCENVPGLAMSQSSLSYEPMNLETCVQKNYYFNRSGFSHRGQYLTSTANEWEARNSLGPSEKSLNSFKPSQESTLTSSSTRFCEEGRKRKKKIGPFSSSKGSPIWERRFNRSESFEEPQNSRTSRQRRNSSTTT